MRDPAHVFGAAGPLDGGVIGAVFFLWIMGWCVVVPTEIAWLMRQDWRIHFLGWHMFRVEDWSWPPGLINGREIDTP